MFLRVCAVGLLSAVPALGAETEVLSIVPKPARIERSEGRFVLDARTKVVLGKGAEAFVDLAQGLAESIRQRTGQSIEVQRHPGSLPNKQILLFPADAARSLGDEGYEIVVGPETARLTAAKPAGMFYAVQTLGQLLAEATGAANARSWGVPCVKIEDRPRFAWRGMNLDVARHFFDKPFVKRYIDHLAACKINVFHLYLTDDQGWRIEIKRYPRLTEVGAWRKGTKKHYAHGGGDDKRYGGFFTQDDLREIVAYARERFITVVPGISMPGHSQAALAAYPELSSTGGPFEVWTEWGISKEVMDPGREEVFRFVEGVLAEAVAIFPSRYIHTGGDEVPRDRWKASSYAQARMRREGLNSEDELQSYFTKRVERFLNSKGRQLVGWDEILEGGLAPNAVVMSWRGTQGGITAARAKHQVVMVPHQETYFNYMQHKAQHGPGHAGYLPLSTVYRFDPLRGLTAEESKYVLGGQACLWTEYVRTPEDVEYLLFPRLLAMAEALWSPPEGRNEQDFRARLPAQLASLRRAGIRYCEKLEEE
jgi:hexosaminidase